MCDTAQTADSEEASLSLLVTKCVCLVRDLIADSGNAGWMPRRGGNAQARQRKEGILPLLAWIVLYHAVSRGAR